MLLNPKRTLSVVTLLLFPITLSVAFSWLANSQSQKPSNEEEHKKLVEAIRRGGLREAARIKGAYVITKTASWDAVFSDTESLTSHSTLVVIGVPVESTPRLSTDGTNVVTDFTVNVIETLKSEVNLTPPSIMVSAVGGLIKFDDGTSVEVRTPDLEIRNSRKYVLFLSEKDAENRYHLVGGSQGVFELRDNGAGVIPQGRETDLVIQKYKGADTESFLKEIRRASEKWPASRKCCFEK